ncbi:MAG: hypothetical protein NC548_28465, partial [Lachnospiraceae bacterium]|nr:hypothetical protein [Lachnospiraceae bacterium]
VIKDDIRYFTEDTNSGSQYYSKHLKGSVTPAKDNIHYTDCIGKGTIIADGAILGPQCQQWNSKGIDVDLFAPVSFEYLIERYYDSYYKGYYLDRVPLQLKSLERYFTACVERRFPGYDKSKCPDEVMVIDLLADFRANKESSIFDDYCAKFGITDKEDERNRLCSVYGTTDFEKYIKDDFGL